MGFQRFFTTTLLHGACTAYVLVAFGMLGSPGSEGVATAQSDPSLVASLPVGDTGVTYGGTDGTEDYRWGPASFRVGLDGSLLIADTAARRVLVLSTDGRLRESIALPDAAAVSDVAFDGNYVLALDLSAELPTLYTMRRDGTSVQVQVLRDFGGRAVSGLTQRGGANVLELEGGIAAATPTGQITEARNGLRLGRHHVAFEAGLRTPGQRTLFVDGTRIDIRAVDSITAIKYLGSAPGGDIFVLVEEANDSQTIEIDQTVRRYSASGAYISSARVPLSEQYTYVDHSVAVAPSGDVLALVTRPERVDIVRLAFAERLPRILGTSRPAEARFAEGETLSATGLQTASTCVAAQQMYDAAMAYVFNSVHLSTTNLHGQCAGRTKPRYLGSRAGTYASVPYDWGGYDTVAAFNASMAQGRTAGDIHTKGVEACSSGVDCSGFLSRVWGTSRHTTRTLPSISTPIARANLRRGDILNKSGDHVAMIDEVVQDGVYTVESTMYNSYDRVVRIFNGWGRFNKYSGYRYKNACATSLEPLPAQIQNPTPNSTLGGSVQTFSWSTGRGVNQYFLYVGTSLGQNNIFGASVGGTSATVSGLPTNGSRVYARIWSLINGAWKFHDASYGAANMAAPVPAQITSPTPGSTLSGSKQKFKWTKGQGVSRYFLYVGTGYGQNNLYGSAVNGTSVTVKNLPRNGTTLYVRIWSLIGGVWHIRDATFRAAMR